MSPETGRKAHSIVAEGVDRDRRDVPVARFSLLPRDAWPMKPPYGWYGRAPQRQ